MSGTAADQEKVLGKLQEIETEMRHTGRWDPGLDAAGVRARAEDHVRRTGMSPVGTIPFEHWLQAVFVPNARAAAISGSLPSSSQVSLMAMREYDYQSSVPDAQVLLRLLREFDALFPGGE